MNIDGRTKVYGVIGRPVGHTASPVLHNAAFGALGINACYVPFDVGPEGVADAVRGMRAMNMAGLNVTVPHKRAVIPLLDGLAGEAERLLSVNTIVRDAEGGLIGHNTDAAGFLRMLEEENVQVKGARALVFGAGGAAPAVIRALELGGAAGVRIVNRTGEKAEALARIFSGDSFEAAASDFSDGSIDTFYQKAGIIINATSLGLRAGDMPPVNPKRIDAHHVVIDIIYNPWKTALLDVAEKRGARALNGYGMLLHQAAVAFTLWTGLRAPVEVMRRAGMDFVRGRAV